MYLCGATDISDTEKLKLIREKASNAYDIFRVIERYRNMKDTTETKTFMVGDVLKMLEKAYRRQGLKINIITDFEITIKKTLLVQSLVNLIENAYSHNKNDYGNKDVLLTVCKNEITVSDNGDGVSDNIRDKIFDLFFTTKDLDKLSGEHNGIGLYGVKQHIDALGYSISVENDTILKGANFKIKIN
jgi:signal transduction histidine kinase